MRGLSTGCIALSSDRRIKAPTQIHAFFDRLYKTSPKIFHCHLKPFEKVIYKPCWSKPLQTSEKPLVLGIRWCVRGFRPLLNAYSTPAWCLDGVKRVPSLNNSNCNQTMKALNLQQKTSKQQSRQKLYLTAKKRAIGTTFFRELVNFGLKLVVLKISRIPSLFVLKF